MLAALGFSKEGRSARDRRSILYLILILSINIFATYLPMLRITHFVVENLTPKFC